MNREDRAAIERCSKESLAGERTFPEVVGALAAAGVDSYFADYRGGVTTYYARSGGALPLALPTHGAAPAGDFDAPALQQAIRAAQKDELRYPDFVQRALAAGCVGYHVWIDGRHVTYYGRRGETHLERFPGSD